MKGFIEIWDTEWGHARHLVNINVDEIAEVSVYLNYENDEEHECFTEITTKGGTHYLSDESIGAVKAKINSASEKHKGLFETLRDVFTVCWEHSGECEEGCPLYEQERRWCDWEYAFGKKPEGTNIWHLEEAVKGYENAKYEASLRRTEDDD